VVEALAGMKEPAEMDHGDVYKIDIRKRIDNRPVCKSLDDWQLTIVRIQAFKIPTKGPRMSAGSNDSSRMG
jgi:hypothetical protein